MKLTRINQTSYIQSFFTFALLIRELRVFLRSFKSFLCLALFLGTLLFVTTQNWAAFTQHFRPGDMDIARGSRELLQSLTIGHLMMIVLLMPILMAPAIVEEREKSTLAMLLSSPISVFGLVMSKFFTPIIYLFMLLTASAPVLALCFIGGGLAINDVFNVYLLLLTATLMYGSLSLFCSTFRSRVYEVYLISVFAMLFFALFLPFHGTVWAYISQARFVEDTMDVNHGFHFLSPFFALSELISPSLSRAARSDVMGIYLMLSLGSTVLFLISTMVRVAGFARGNLWGKERSDETDIVKKHPLQVHDRGYDITFSETSDEGNPGLVLERRVQWFARVDVLIRLFYLALMISIITLPLSSYQGSWLFLSLPFVSAVFFTLPLAATSISSDHERETFNLLRTTLLSTSQIVRAKFTTSLRYCFFIALALYVPGMLLQIFFGWVVGYDVDLATGASDTTAMLLYPVILFLSLVMYTAWGLYCSAYFQQSNKALIVSGLVILVTLFFPFVLPRGNFETLTVFSYGWTFLIMFMSPLAGVASLFPEGSIRMLNRSLFFSNANSMIVYLFVAMQCFVFLFATSILLKRTKDAIERN